LTIEELADQVTGLTGAIDQLEARCAENEQRAESVRAWTLDLSTAVLAVANLATEALVTMDTTEDPVEALLRPILVGLVAVGELATRTAVAVGAPQP
jgi:hypothetical protein